MKDNSAVSHVVGVTARNDVCAVIDLYDLADPVSRTSIGCRLELKAHGTKEKMQELEKVICDWLDKNSTFQPLVKEFPSQVADGQAN